MRLREDVQCGGGADADGVAVFVLLAFSHLFGGRARGAAALVSFGGSVGGRVGGCRVHFGVDRGDADRAAAGAVAHGAPSRGDQRFGRVVRDVHRERAGDLLFAAARARDGDGDDRVSAHAIEGSFGQRARRRRQHFRFFDGLQFPFPEAFGGAEHEFRHQRHGVDREQVPLVEARFAEAAFFGEFEVFVVFGGHRKHGRGVHTHPFRRERRVLGYVEPRYGTECDRWHERFDVDPVSVDRRSAGLARLTIVTRLMLTPAPIPTVAGDVVLPLASASTAVSALSSATPRRRR